MPIIQYDEARDGALAEITFTTTLNGVQRIDSVYQIRTLTATVEYNNVPVNRLGTKSPMILQRGWSGTGSLSLFDATPRLDQITEQYIQNYIPFRFDIVVSLNDPAVQQAIGSKIVQLRNVVPQTYDVVSVDVDADYITNDFDFLFEDINYLQHWDFRYA